MGLLGFKSNRLACFAAVLLLVGACTSGSSGLADLSIPATGDVEPEYLDDGHPVFVVHDLDDSVYVVEAISTHLEEEPMAWCASSRTIDDILHGSIWDPAGRYVAGPGPSDLGTYEFAIAEDGRELTVTAYVQPSPRSKESSAIAGPRCPDGGEYVVHPYFDD